VVERTRDGGRRAEAAEGELEHGRALLGPVAAPLEGRSEPRARADLARRPEVAAVEALRPDHVPVAQERDEVAVPPARRPAGERGGVELAEPVEVEVVRPRDAERHLVGRVDARLGEREELVDLLRGRQAQLEARRAEAECEQRAGIHPATVLRRRARRG
jgi:hypothetical protein